MTNITDTFSVLHSAFLHCYVDDLGLSVSRLINFAGCGLYHNDPLVVNTSLAIMFAFLCWAVSVIAHNYSQVDRLWSIAPVVYAAIFARDGWSALLSGHVPSYQLRLVVISLLIFVWGSRLSYNFWRKGGYNWKDEDYRWPMLRSKLHPIVFQVFNVTFIATYQHLLLFLITLPIYVCYSSKQPLNIIDGIASFLFVLLLTGETVADQQQWVFQNEKHRLLKTPGAHINQDYAKGFLTKGLFQYSRHPNFFCEISLWWVVYLFSIAATQTPFNWSVVGAILLTLLFQGSTTFTEYISKQKYPQYAVYQTEVNRLIPWFRKTGSNKKLA